MRKYSNLLATVSLLLVLVVIAALLSTPTTTPSINLEDLLIAHSGVTVPLEEVLIYMSAEQVVEQGYGILEVNYNGHICIFTYVVAQSQETYNQNQFSHDLECLP